MPRGILGKYTNECWTTLMNKVLNILRNNIIDIKKI